MSISFHQEERAFRLDTPGSTYLIALADQPGFLGHMYYGRRIPDTAMRHLLRLDPAGPPFQDNGDQLNFLGDLPTEYPGCGLGDYRESCLRVETEEGFRACNLTYRSHAIHAGKPALPGLPATRGGQEDCSTLELICADEALELEVHLYYTAYEELDAICRSARIVNRGSRPVKLTAALSACLDMDNRDFDLITLHGSWAYERMIQRRRLGWGTQGVCSQRGISSHSGQPFLALAEHDANQEHGQVYAMNLV